MVRFVAYKSISQRNIIVLSAHWQDLQMNIDWHLNKRKRFFRGGGRIVFLFVCLFGGVVIETQCVKQTTYASCLKNTSDKHFSERWNIPEMFLDKNITQKSQSWGKDVFLLHIRNVS